MTSETPSSAFEHDPLPDSLSHFRLLHILRGDFGQHVECELSSWLIDDAPSYYAISYTWGDPADTTEITVNGKPLAVRRNCEYVLQQAFTTKASRYYWVDAICIAQMSIQERNHQVRMMGKIYSRAKHVFACVGPHADDSDYLMAVIDQRRPLLETVYEWGQSTGLYNTFYTSGSIYSLNPIDKHVYRQLRSLFTMRTSKRLRTSEAFLSFMRRPYFTRVWILQELHLATRTSYCCGADVLPGEYLRALDSLVEYWIYRHNQGQFKILRRCQIWILRRSIPADRPSNRLLESLQQDFSHEESHRGCLRLGLSARKQDLHGVLMMLMDFHCEDPRDNLYGILSLVRWSQGQGPKPDYTKDNFEVAKHVLSICFRNDSYESLIYQCSYLVSLFRVTLELASLRDAIALRSSVAPQADLRLQDNHAFKIAKVQVNWVGIQIVEGGRISEHADGRRQSNLHSCYVEQVQNGHFVLMRMGSHMTMRVHVDTKVGDWCLVEDMSPLRNGGYGLILRELDDHKYVVVGSALILYQDYRSRIGLEEEQSRLSRFKGWSDPEDLMVLAWMLNELKGKKKVSDENIEKFLNMRLCGWKNSSYFEKVVEDV